MVTSEAQKEIATRKFMRFESIDFVIEKGVYSPLDSF